MFVLYCLFFFFFKQKTAYEIYQCDWSSDVCSSDLVKEIVILSLSELQVPLPVDVKVKETEPLAISVAVGV